jgi:hypothetical protein
MKRILLPMLAMMVAAFTLTSCSDDDIVGARVLTTYYDIHNDQWQAAKDNNGNVLYYYVECSNNNVDFENGAVTAYYCTTDGDKALPYTIYNALDQDSNGVLDYYYEDHLSYDIQKNGVTFILESSDFGVEHTIANVGELQFKVSVIRNDYLTGK